jgi:signal transduction histidine kinase
MRRRAAALSAGASGQRLPLPPSNDEVARLGATLNDLLARVDATLERERQFVANASHELRTPLSLLKTELELAVRTPKSAEDLTAAVHSAADEVDRLIQLAEDLLLLASFHEGRLHVVPRQVDVEALLTGVAARFQHTADRLGRHISVRANAVPSLQADLERLEQALANLVSNAMEHGGGEVTLSVRAVGDAAEIHVTDEGGGFSPEMLAHGFERFFHTPSTTGSGLGLSIVAAVAEAHAGCAGVTNRLTGGSDVWIRLPQRAGRLLPIAANQLTRCR